MPWLQGLRTSAAAVPVTSLLMLAGDPPPALALPSYARQTGLQCMACHMTYPELTPTGRRFKLTGYADGGPLKYPPLSAQVIGQFTHTNKDQSDPPQHFGPNDNVMLQEVSVYYAGRIFDNAGAFAQLTYDATERKLALDNSDIRIVREGMLGGVPVIAGLFADNNPTLEDPYNTLPAWGYPFNSSPVAPQPAASTLIEGNLAQTHAGGGGYALWNNAVYAEAAVYTTLGAKTRKTLGAEGSGIDTVDGGVPYWRLAVQQEFGSHFIEAGTFGLHAPTFPGGESSQGHDTRTDTGLDLEYQYLGDPHYFSFQASYIHESQNWSASQVLGLTANDHDSLDALRLKGTYIYEHVWQFNVGFLDRHGSSDPVLYSNPHNARPDTRAWIFEVDWLPFNDVAGGNGAIGFWPWLNPRLGLQYTAYDRFDGSTRDFDGSGRKASDNNTLYLFLWVAL